MGIHEGVVGFETVEIESKLDYLEIRIVEHGVTETVAAAVGIASFGRNARKPDCFFRSSIIPRAKQGKGPAEINSSIKALLTVRGGSGREYTLLMRFSFFPVDVQ